MCCSNFCAIIAQRMALPILLEPDIILELSVLLNFSNMSMSDKDTPDGKVKRAKNRVYRGLSLRDFCSGSIFIPSVRLWWVFRCALIAIRE